jgi:hypothetical protein
MASEHTQVSDATRQAESEEAQARHGGGPETSEEEATPAREVDQEVRASYREMVELGAEEAGEGRIP